MENKPVFLLSHPLQFSAIFPSLEAATPIISILLGVPWKKKKKGKNKDLKDSFTGTSSTNYFLLFKRGFQKGSGGQQWHSPREGPIFPSYVEKREYPLMRQGRKRNHPFISGVFQPDRCLVLWPRWYLQRSRFQLASSPTLQKDSQEPIGFSSTLLISVGNKSRY